jgi:hypothetical protein
MIWKIFYFTTFVFVQIYKLYGYGQYTIHGSVINVFANVNQIQSILPHLLNDFDDKEIHCTPTNLMIYNFLDA